VFNVNFINKIKKPNRWVGTVQKSSVTLFQFIIYTHNDLKNYKYPVLEFERHIFVVLIQSNVKSPPCLIKFCYSQITQVV
jgi:hypothetical protein